jgi:hypothetical protein
MSMLLDTVVEGWIRDDADQNLCQIRLDLLDALADDCGRASSPKGALTVFPCVQQKHCVSEEVILPGPGLGASQSSESLIEIGRHCGRDVCRRI